MKILSFISYYYPSFKSGGPVKTLKNMVEKLDKINFYIVTRDRDLGDKRSFSNINLNSWQEVDTAKVLYLPPESFSINNIAEIINDSSCQIIYLNSFFDLTFTFKPLLTRKFGMIDPCHVVLAPRGEFSAGALALKSWRKRLFIKLSSVLGIYNDVIWQASSQYEKHDIIAALNIHPSSVFIAKDLPSKGLKNESGIILKANETCRLVFLSRVSPMKNLDFALQVLGMVKADLIFDIYGPIEDKSYWQDCLKLVQKLPSNIKVNYCGAVEADQVMDVLCAYDLFFFPTRGESYGHVIAESLSVGTPALISDQTPWKNLAIDSLGWDLPLNVEKFVEKIELVAARDAQSRLEWRQQVALSSASKISNEQDIEDNIALFQFALDTFNKD